MTRTGRQEGPTREDGRAGWNDAGHGGLLRQEGDDVGQRVHICVGAVCNNNCLFCMEEDRSERAATVGAWARTDVLDVIAKYAGVREILFTSGEPTMNPNLPDYIRAARDAGYEVIGVISNGRRFSYPPFAIGLLRAGLNNVIVSIHGPDAHTHDALTRTKGSFDQTLAGLRTLAGLKPSFGLKLQTSTVVTRRNLPRMREFCDLMAPIDVDAHAFNVMMPDGGGLTHLDALMPRYTEVAAEFERITREIDPALVGRMALVDIPYCTTEGLPDQVRGYVERYFHFEPDGAFEAKAAAAGVTKTAVMDDESNLYVRGALAGKDATYSKVTRTYQEAWVKSKRPECAGCRYFALCRGVWKPYTDRFGWDEFTAVK